MRMKRVTESALLNIDEMLMAYRNHAVEFHAKLRTENRRSLESKES